MHPFREKHVCSFKTRKTYENRNEHITRRATLPHPCLRLAGTGHALLPQLRAPLGQRAAEAVDHAQPRAPLPPPRGWVLPRAADSYAEAGEGGGGRTGRAVRNRPQTILIKREIVRIRFFSRRDPSNLSIMM